MSKLTEMAGILNTPPVKNEVIEPKVQLDAQTSTLPNEPVHDQTSERSDTLDRIDLNNRTGISKYKLLFDEVSKRANWKRLNGFIEPGHSLAIERIRYKILLLTGVKADISDVIKVVFDEALPKFEKHLDKEIIEKSNPQ
jgi:hypothetical protein